MKPRLTKEEVYNIVFEYVKKYDGIILKDIDINNDIKHFEESFEEQYQEYVKRCNLNGHEIDASLFQKKDSSKDYNFWILNHRVPNLDGGFHGTTYYVIDTTGKVESMIDHYGQTRYPHLEIKKLEIEDEWDLYDENMDLIMKAWKYGIPSYPELEKIVALPFHEKTNQLILDFNDMNDERFIEKYALLRFWETTEGHKKEKKSTNILGKILVCILGHFGYLTEYEPLEEINIDDVHNFWNESSVRFVEFKIDSKNRFCAFIPYKNYVKSILDIKIEDVF